MAKLQQIAEIVRRAAAPTPAEETKRFFVCPHCAQAVDVGSLAEVVHHNDREHAPICFAA